MKNIYLLLSTNKFRLKEEKVFKQYYPQLYKEILQIDFPTEFKFSQKLYHYFNNDYNLSLGLCSCGNRCRFISFNKGYVTHCSRKCAMNDETTKNKYKETCMSTFGVDNAAKSEIIKNKRNQNCNIKYGVDNVFQLDDVKEKRKQTILFKYGKEHPMQTQQCKDKYKKTSKQKFGTDFYIQSNEGKEHYKQTCLKRYNVDWFSKSENYKMKHDEIQSKINFSKKQHNTFHTSNIEQEIINYFQSTKINYIKDYHSTDYPFNCDFYLTDYKLYIEIQGTWTHGNHPFNENDPTDIYKLNVWKSKNTKYYDNAVETWTIRDVNKRKTALKNNLNFIEIFSIDIDEVIQIIENKLKELY